MAMAGRRAIQELVQVLGSEDGLKPECDALTRAAAIEYPGLISPEITDLHAPAELVEKTASVKYPKLYVYCDRVVNALSEKFRTFSGTADLSVEIRVSHQHAGELQSQLQMYVEAVTNVLDRKRGRWPGGVFYTGGYEVVFSPVKRGGKNYLQTARVKIEVHISV
jgi:hypothetical protein